MQHCARQNSNIINIIANFMPQIHSETQSFICPSNPGELAMIGSYKLKHVVTLFALLGSTPTMAQMSEVLDQGEALAVDAKIYASNYGVNQEEALRRLLIMLDQPSVQREPTTIRGLHTVGDPRCVCSCGSSAQLVCCRKAAATIPSASTTATSPPIR